MRYKQKGIDFKFEQEIGDSIYTIAIKNYQFGRPAPNCSNPDNPAYSDPGDDSEFDDYKIFDENDDLVTDKKQIETVDNWIDGHYDVIDDKASGYVEKMGLFE